MHSSFLLPFKINERPDSFSFTKPLLLLGSCFSDEIAERFRYGGFTVHANPMGTIFHPISISRFLAFIMTERDFPINHIVQTPNYFGSWEASTVIRRESAEEINDYFQYVKQDWLIQLEQASHLFITFGTSWGYVQNEYGMVANCHKFPSTEFKKVLSTAEEIADEFRPVLKTLINRFPKLNIVFTVSPVRHVRDGLVENNQSKAELIRAVHRVCSASENCSYFPSYELIIDVLRDYRFYKKDRVHPSEEAIDYVWEELLNTHGNKELREQLSQVYRFRKMECHQLVSVSDSEKIAWNNRLNDERSKLIESIPLINL